MGVPGKRLGMNEMVTDSFERTNPRESSKMPTLNFIGVEQDLGMGQWVQKRSGEWQEVGR